MVITTNKKLRKKLIFDDYVRLAMADIARASNLGRTNQNQLNQSQNQPKGGR